MDSYPLHSTSKSFSYSIHFSGKSTQSYIDQTRTSCKTRTKGFGESREKVMFQYAFKHQSPEMQSNTYLAWDIVSLLTNEDSGYTWRIIFYCSKSYVSMSAPRLLLKFMMDLLNEISHQRSDQLRKNLQRWMIPRYGVNSETASFKRTVTKMTLRSTMTMHS